MNLYRLSNSPSVFKGFIIEIFRYYLHRLLIIYTNNIQINSSLFSSHVHLPSPRSPSRASSLIKPVALNHHPLPGIHYWYLWHSRLSWKRCKPSSPGPLQPPLKNLQHILWFSNFNSIVAFLTTHSVLVFLNCSSLPAAKKGAFTLVHLHELDP